jgi:hypothetical protein
VSTLNRPFEFQSRNQNFICAHKEKPSIAMRANSLDIHPQDQWPGVSQNSNSPFLEIVSDDFSLPHWIAIWQVTFHCINLD